MTKKLNDLRFDETSFSGRPHMKTPQIDRMTIDFVNAADMGAFVGREMEGCTDMAGKIGCRR